MILRFPTVFAALRNLSTVLRPTYYGACVHCERTTPWVTNTLQGVYHCTECGQDAIKPDA